MGSTYIFTSESVTEGHPDKLCDQISDALVGRYLCQDPHARITAECAVSTGILFVSVKASGPAVVDIPHTAREVILDVGYTRGQFNGDNCTIMTNLTQMAPLPNRGKGENEDNNLAEIIALDNVTTFGFACQQTPTLMPLPIWLAHRLMRRLDSVRRRTLDYLAPDGSCQVGIEYMDNAPVRIDSITLVTAQRRKKKPHLDELRRDLLEEVIRPSFDGEAIRPDGRTRISINPEGIIVEGGPAVHAGLTGRKNGIDTYGGFSRQSGAALSGKDPSRIDRVGAYAARHAAKNVVAAGLAEQCEVQLSYSIGMAAPVSIRALTFGTGQQKDEALTRRIAGAFDFDLRSIIDRFHLRELANRDGGRFYRQLSVYGHVGRSDLDLPWERTDAVDRL